jgi:hypothetical protein
MIIIPMPNLSKRRFVCRVLFARLLGVKKIARCFGKKTHRMEQRAGFRQEITMAH